MKKQVLLEKGKRFHNLNALGENFWWVGRTPKESNYMLLTYNNFSVKCISTIGHIMSVEVLPCCNLYTDVNVHCRNLVGQAQRGTLDLTYRFTLVKHTHRTVIVHVRLL